MNKTSVPRIALLDSEEDCWFLDRSDWLRHHSWRRALPDATLPNVVLRRLGDSLEISWDNESWHPSRADIAFTESRGTELVDAKTASRVAFDGVKDAAQALSARFSFPELKKLAQRSSAPGAREHDWKWLLHQETATALEKQLKRRLDRHTREHRVGPYVPHTPATRALSCVKLGTADDIRGFLSALEVVPQTPIARRLQQLIPP